MSRETKVRVVAFVSSTIAEQYAQLSRKFGISRSELFRMALQRGYRPLASWCEKTRETFVGDGGGSAESGSDQPSRPVASPAAQLSEFCRVLVDQDPELGVDQVRAMARAQSAVVGVPSADADEVVAGVLEQLFPSELHVAGGDDGDVGRRGPRRFYRAALAIGCWGRCRGQRGSDGLSGALAPCA